MGKVETQGTNKRVNIHRNDANRPDSIAIDRLFSELGHDFNRDFRIIVIEEITKKNLTKDQMRELLLRREDFWILKLGTLHPRGFNDKLNYPYEVGSRNKSPERHARPPCTRPERRTSDICRNHGSPERRATKCQ